MSSIRDIRSPWRDALLPASYKGAEFHVEVMSEDSGRRLVTHEFPKKERGYVEDMGKRTMSFTVRGYVITYVRDTNFPLYQTDYRIARDRLRDVLDSGGPGRLQLPSIASVIVACDRYQMSEEQRLGGYCTFNMLFVEQGVRETPQPSSRDTLMSRAAILRQQVIANLVTGSTGPPRPTGPGLIAQEPAPTRARV